MRDEIRSELRGEALRGVIREELHAIGHKHAHKSPLAAGTSRRIRSGTTKSPPREHRHRRSPTRGHETQPTDDHDAAAAERSEPLSPRTQAAIYEA